MSNENQIPLALKNGYDRVFQYVKDEFKDCDLLIANLETPLSDDPSHYSRKKYTFCAPRSLAASLHKLNDHLVLLNANNHCLDNDVSGLDETIRILDEERIEHAGIQSGNRNEYLMLDAGGKSIALLNYTYGTNAFSNHVFLSKHEQKRVNLLQNQELSNGFYRWFLATRFFPARCFRWACRHMGIFQINTMPYERVSLSKSKERAYLRMVRQASKKADFVISCPHIGGQYNAEPSTYTRRIIAKTCRKIFSGAVLANHEHVIHPLTKESGGVFCAYSLGNFLGANGVTEGPFDKMADYSIAINIYLSKDGSVPAKFSYSIYKCEDENGLSVVHPLYNLLASNPERDDLKNGLETITKCLSGTSLEPRKEYFVD